MENASTQSAQPAPTVAPRMTDSVNRQTVPHDLRKKRFENGYVVASCDTRDIAERAVVQLQKEGFDRDDMVLVSEEVDTLRPSALGDSLEVRNPTSLAKASGFVAGAATGAAVGAAISLAVAFIISGGDASFASAVLGGGVVGGLLGAFFGRWFSARMRRSPASVYDERFLKSEIMVGVGVAADKPEAHRARATRALERAGLKPTHLAGDSA